MPAGQLGPEDTTVGAGGAADGWPPSSESGWRYSDGGLIAEWGRAARLQRVSTIIDALRIVLEEQPDETLEQPAKWAEGCCIPRPPIHRKSKLAPIKEALLDRVARALAYYASIVPVRAANDPGFWPYPEIIDVDSTVKAAAEVIAEARHGTEPPTGAPPRWVRLMAGTLVGAASDPRLYPLGTVLKLDKPLDELVTDVALALGRLEPSAWSNLEAIVKCAWRAMGASKDVTRQFFHYRQKRGDRGSKLPS